MGRGRDDFTIYYFNGWGDELLTEFHSRSRQALLNSGRARCKHKRNGRRPNGPKDEYDVRPLSVRKERRSTPSLNTTEGRVLTIQGMQEAFYECPPT